MMNIKKGQEVRIKREFQDAGDDSFKWFAVEDEDGGRVAIRPELGLTFNPIQVVRVDMLEAANEAD